MSRFQEVFESVVGGVGSDPQFLDKLKRVIAPGGRINQRVYDALIEEFGDEIAETPEESDLPQLLADYAGGNRERQYRILDAVDRADRLLK